MNNFSSVRNRRSLLDFSGFTPIQFPISNYSTSAQTKTEMKHAFEESILINNLHLIPDPLKKNLADSVITGEDKKTDMGNTNEFITRGPERPHQRDFYLSLAGITSFFSGVFNVMGAMFQKRSTSPVPQYYDCYENDYDEHQMASNPWHSSKYEVQNKNERAQVSNESNKKLDVEMNADCRIAASNCEDKINQVRLLLENENQKNVPITKFKPRRPKMAFIEADSVENMFEEAIPSEDILLPNEKILEYYCPYSYQDGELYETDSPKVKTEIINESLDIIRNLPTTSLPIENENKTDLNENIDITIDTLKDENIEKPIEAAHIVSSCEEKLNKLKALLKTCHNKNKDLPINNVDVSEPMDIPNSNTKINKDIETETIFYNDINSSDLKKNNCFNEVTGKFYSSSIESEDSFQIVFSDSPQNFECTRRLPSDCESEDSFIMFEETPDSCYTNNDVFGDDTYQDSSDSDSDIEDSGCITKLSPNLSRTFGDLTDNSLYSEDVVDYSVNLCDHAYESKQMSTGLLLNEKRKLEKKKQPTKKVHFSTQPPKVHVMRVWAFAARQARAGHWERHALDRERFKRRIADVEMAVSWVLKPQHRSRIVFQRFMPWWNAEKRRELAEKKLKEDKERNKSVNSAEVSVTIDKCDDINKKKEESDNINKSNDEIYSRKKEINCHIGTIVDKTKELDLVGNNFVDENEKISDNDKLEVSVKNKINGIITNEYVLQNINITNLDT